MKREERGPWYLLTGLVIGVALGLAYAWVYKPVVYEKTSPASLGTEYKNQYRALIAAAFAADGNLPRAQARLGLLSDQDPPGAVAVQAQNWLAEKRPEAQALGMLASALGQGTAPAPQPSRTVSAAVPPSSKLSPVPPLTTTGTQTVAVTSSLTQGTATGSASQTGPASTSPGTAAPTITLLPTRTATPTPGAPFYLKDIRPVCDVTLLKTPLIIVEAYDVAGEPVPGIEVIVQWEAGEDHFYTGLKPELGLGYADFTMQPRVTYTLQLAGGGKPVPGIISNECESPSHDRYWGSWKLEFAQP
jgi:hypothetical protein